MGAVGCTVGIAPHLFVGAYGEDKEDALSRAGAMAAEASAAIDSNPALKAVLVANPYGAAAYGAISAAAKLYKSKLTVKDVENEVGPVAARVAKGILSLWGGS